MMSTLGILEYTSVKNIFTKSSFGFVHNCKKCSYSSKSFFLMRNHIKRHRIESKLFFDCSRSTPEIYLCKECNLVTYETTTFNQHFKNHSLQKPAIQPQKPTQACDEREAVTNDGKCPYNTRSRRRKANKDGGKTGKAPVMEPVALQKVKSFKCDHCHFKSYKQRHVERHIIIQHTPLEEIKWFHCDKCTYKGKLENYLKMHIYNKHSDPSDIKWFNCHECSYKAKLKIHLKKHIRSRHTSSSDIEWFNCSECSYKVTSECLLRKHIFSNHTAHRDIKWLYCRKCPHKTRFRTKWEEDLQKHMIKKHTALKDV